MSTDADGLRREHHYWRIEHHYAEAHTSGRSRWYREGWERGAQEALGFDVPSDSPPMPCTADLDEWSDGHRQGAEDARRYALLHLRHGCACRCKN